MSFAKENAAERDVVEQYLTKQDVVETEAASNVHEGEAALREEQGAFVGSKEATSAW